VVNDCYEADDSALLAAAWAISHMGIRLVHKEYI
jgi:hypothetical protein